MPFPVSLLIKIDVSPLFNALVIQQSSEFVLKIIQSCDRIFRKFVGDFSQWVAVCSSWCWCFTETDNSPNQSSLYLDKCCLPFKIIPLYLIHSFVDVLANHRTDIVELQKHSKKEETNRAGVNIGRHCEKQRQHCQDNDLVQLKVDEISKAWQYIFTNRAHQRCCWFLFVSAKYS